VADPTKDQDVINPNNEPRDDEQNPDPRQQIDPQDEIRRRPSPIREEQDDEQSPERKRA
jgi:hypothetical protein